MVDISENRFTFVLIRALSVSSVIIGKRKLLASILNFFKSTLLNNGLEGNSVNSPAKEF